MRVTLLPSCFVAAGDSPHQFLTSFLVNETLAIDAGSLGFALSPERQARVRHLLITHTHADHVASLPVFLETVYRTGPDCVVVHGSEAVLDGLRRDVFNGRTWPDFIELGRAAAPFLRLEPLNTGEPVELEGIRITPVAVDHAVPTQGFILDDGTAAVVIPSDTGPTHDIWERAGRLPHLKAVFLEASFPNAMADLASATRHLTPAQFAAELRKLPRPVRAIAVHLKARYRVQLIAELSAVGAEVVRPGIEYQL